MLFDDSFMTVIGWLSLLKMPKQLNPAESALFKWALKASEQEEELCWKNHFPHW